MNVIEILDRPIAFHRCFVKITGSIGAALMLSHAFDQDPDTDGWFVKTSDEWEAETSLSRHEQEGARAQLREAGVWEEARRGMPAKPHFRVKEQVLESILADPNWRGGGENVNE